MIKDFNVYVFSLPRCFSSACTGVCEKLGIKMIYTSEEKEKRDKMQKNYKKKFGEYVPNEHFYEIVDNQFANWLKVIKIKRSGCKVIIPVNGMRWEAVKYKPCKVILMSRDAEEIRQSQQAFYRGNEFQTPEQAEIRRAEFRSLLAQTEVQLKNAKIEYLIVNTRDLILDKTEETIKKIAKFIGSDKDTAEAVKSIDATKYRFKKEELTENI